MGDNFNRRKFLKAASVASAVGAGGTGAVAKAAASVATVATGAGEATALASSLAPLEAIKNAPPYERAMFMRQVGLMTCDNAGLGKFVLNEVDSSLGKFASEAGVAAEEITAFQDLVNNANVRLPDDASFGSPLERPKSLYLLDPFLDGYKKAVNVKVSLQDQHALRFLCESRPELVDAAQRYSQFALAEYEKLEAFNVSLVGAGEEKIFTHSTAHDYFLSVYGTSDYVSQGTKRNARVLGLEEFNIQDLLTKIESHVQQTVSDSLKELSVSTDAQLDLISFLETGDNVDRHKSLFFFIGNSGGNTIFPDMASFDCDAAIGMGDRELYSIKYNPFKKGLAGVQLKMPSADKASKEERDKFYSQQRAYLKNRVARYLLENPVSLAGPDFMIAYDTMYSEKPESEHSPDPVVSRIADKMNSLTPEDGPYAIVASSLEEARVFMAAKEAVGKISHIKKKFPWAVVETRTDENTSAMRDLLDGFDRLVLLAQTGISNLEQKIEKGVQGVDQLTSGAAKTLDAIEEQATSYAGQLEQVPSDLAKEVQSLEDKLLLGIEGIDLLATNAVEKVSALEADITQGIDEVERLASDTMTTLTVADATLSAVEDRDIETDCVKEKAIAPSSPQGIMHNRPS